MQITNYAFRITFFLLIISFNLTACQPINCFDEKVFCAALVTDTLGIEDNGINQGAWLGLQKSKEAEIANQIVYIESIDPRDYQKNIAYFANRGYDLIITSGIGLQDETSFSALAYPQVVFVGLNQPFEEQRANLISITFPEDQMGFAAGAFAAKLSQSGVVAGVCETSGIDSMWRYCEGFRAGALFADPRIKVFISYRDDGDREKLFVDEDWGYETASSLINRGADVIFAAGGVTGQGALKAATDFNMYAIGTERDQAGALRESGLGVFTSFYGQSQLEVQDVMRLIKAGNISGNRIGQFGFVALNQKFPESLGFELDFLITMLESEEISTNVSAEKR